MDLILYMYVGGGELLEEEGDHVHVHVEVHVHVVM